MKVQKKLGMRPTPQLAFEFVASRARSYDWQDAQGCLVVALFFSACRLRIRPDYTSFYE